MALSIPAVLVIGAGPAALVIAAELAERGLAVTALAPADPAAPWLNTYGNWVDEVEALGLSPLLSHRWAETVSHFGAGGGGTCPADAPLRHGRAYGLFDKALLPGHLLERAARHGVRWQRGSAVAIEHDSGGSSVRLRPCGGADSAATAPLSVGTPSAARAAASAAPPAGGDRSAGSAEPVLRASLVIDATGHEPVFV